MQMWLSFVYFLCVSTSPHNKTAKTRQILFFEIDSIYGWSCEKSGNKTGMKMCEKTTLYLLHDGWILVPYAQKV